MYGTSLLSTIVLAASAALAARPGINFYSESDCTPETTFDGSYGPIPSDVCQVLTGFHPDGPAFGAKVTKAYPPGCTCELSHYPCSILDCYFILLA